jgi:hypothetical protein
MREWWMLCGASRIGIGGQICVAALRAKIDEQKRLLLRSARTLLGAHERQSLAEPHHAKSVNRQATEPKNFGIGAA